MHWILSTEGIFHASLSDNEEAEQRLWDGFKRVIKLLCSFSFLPALPPLPKDFPVTFTSKPTYWDIGHHSLGANLLGIK